MSQTKELLPANYDELVDMLDEGLLTQDEFDRLIKKLTNQEFFALMEERGDYTPEDWGNR